MKPVRNDLCPCGSGKKYKRCCYLKEQGVAAEGTWSDADPFEDLLDDEESMYAAMSKMLTGLRKFTLDRKPHIKAYYKIRRLHSEVVGAMIQYFYDGKFEQTLDAAYAFESERKSGDGGSLLMLESAFDLNTPVGERAFFDMLLYKKAPNINCITEDFIQKRRYRKPEKIEFLNSMLDSKAGLFEITGTDIDEGYAYLKEVFTGLEYKIVDIGLSGNRNNDEIYIYTRIITYNGINFGTGLNFVFSKTDSFPVGYNRNKSRNPHRIKVS